LFVSLTLFAGGLYIPQLMLKRIVVSGRVEFIEGNLMPGSKSTLVSIMSKPVEVVAAPGIVKAIEGQSYIFKERLPRNSKRLITDSNGKFIFNLTPGIYTFFLVQNDKAYQNGFDKNGNFEITKVKKKIEELILRYDKGAYY
tara:strand:- start:171 stop:596 length:426 start_codon:yes stop_codon:yes gene_type:complete